MTTRVICFSPTSGTYYLAYCEVPLDLLNGAPALYRAREVPDSLVARYEAAGAEWAGVQIDLAAIFAAG